ncbi:FeoA family protein [Hydrogenoanaerobacterium sp.]|uniref:FeoA family protein n=1 Tax=Hydrogenoanaerobacterium sp. TaxID=2953763 RepID=UPI00289CC8C8|nr:FeoA family protein [Hydrogenoanaerobacterium sp.]
MPLSMARSGAENSIKSIHGKDETRRFLESLGFVVGGSVTVISEMGGNLIVNVKDTRVAISKGMASRILV